MRFARSVRGVAVGLLQLIRFSGLQELEEALGSGTLFAVLQEHRVLTDRLIVLGRNNPAGAFRDLAVLVNLGQCNETNLSVAGLHELEGLADVVTGHELRLILVEELQGLQGFISGFAIRSELRVGNSALIELHFLHSLAILIHELRIGGPEHELALSIGESGALHTVAVGKELGGSRIISCEQDVERSAVIDLSEESTGAAERQLHLVAGLLLENRGEFLSRRREVGSNCNLDFFSSGRKSDGKDGGNSAGDNSSRKFHILTCLGSG